MKFYFFKRITIQSFIIAVFGLFSFGSIMVFAQTGCSLINKDNPVFFVSYEQMTGLKKDRRARLRLNNNSSCSIVVPVDISETKTTESQACVSDTFHELKNDSQVRLGYKVYYPKTNSIEFPFGGDVMSVALLKSGQSILFDVPLKSLKQGDLELDFQYNWEVCNVAQNQLQIMHSKLSFSSSVIPKEMLR